MTPGSGSGRSGQVVGAALVRDGRVLAARRTRPATAAGRWEFPGGKVEPGEAPAAALEREVVEELGCAVAVRRWLTGSAPVTGGRVLTVAVVALRAGQPEPRASEHDALRWLSAGELDDVDWLAADRPFLPELRALLDGTGLPPGPGAAD